MATYWHQKEKRRPRRENSFDFTGLPFKKKKLSSGVLGYLVALLFFPDEHASQPPVLVVVVVDSTPFLSLFSMHVAFGACVP